MKHLALALVAICLAAPALAETTQLSTHVYKVDEGVTFSISNSGASSFLFSWSDSGGTFTNVEDPSIIVSINETYVFQRTTGSHPLLITDATLPTDGTDGSYFRTTTDAGVINAAVLTPVADFTADPAPTSDQISWTPTGSQIGNYFYTCAVTFHTGMTGGIRVVMDTVDTDDQSVSELKGQFQE